VRSLSFICFEFPFLLEMPFQLWILKS